MAEKVDEQPTKLCQEDQAAIDNMTSVANQVQGDLERLDGRIDQLIKGPVDELRGGIAKAGKTAENLTALVELFHAFKKKTKRRLSNLESFGNDLSADVERMANDITGVTLNLACQVAYAANNDGRKIVGVARTLAALIE